jgi:hypothetical protein
MALKVTHAMTKKIKKVSKKKMLFVELDEEITSIFEKIEKLNYSEIYLVVPKRAVLLQSIVNLKILKQKLDDIGKEMAIITDDTNGMKLAHQAEVRIFDYWEAGGSEFKKAPEKPKDSALLTPIAASSNEIDTDGPSRLPKKKSSIFEVVRTIRTKDDGFSLRTYLRDRKKNRIETEPLHVSLPGGNRKFIFGLLGASILVFGFIAYVALPGATVSIEPASDVVTKGVNIVLETSPQEARSLKAYALDAETELTITHPASGILSEGANAAGYVTLINKSDLAWPLVASTRLQSPEGIIYRIQDAVTVPSGSEVNPGTAEAYVVADPVDANGTAVGDRGNIGPSGFVLPGLRESSQDVLYAESYTDMSGGETMVSAIVLEDDLIAAREKLETQLKEKVLSALRKEALSQGSSLNVSLDILEDSDVLQYSAADIDMPYELLGQEMEDFEITGSMALEGIAYDASALLAILKTEIVTATTPGKSLIRIDEDSISINVMEANNALSYYKFTAQIQGIEEYVIDPNEEAGSKLAKKIKEHIAGKTIEEGENYVQNLPEVNSATISLWPGWSPTIPTLPENIRIKSLSESEQVELEE